jgi:hypothetical protein
MWLGQTFKYASSDGSKMRGDATQYELMVQQQFVRDYLQHASPYRGLLLYHGLGSGKTCAAIAASEALRGARQVVVMLPAALQSNYVREVKKCGGARFSESQSWRFVPIMYGALPEADEDHAGDVDPKLLQTHGGRWIPDATTAGTPFDALNASDQTQVSAQVMSAVQRTHRFINYNGLTAAKVRALCAPESPNPFDDAVVVVDEAHGFVVSVGNKGLAADVYQRIMDAQRTKVVLLSGTPLVNQPRELALLANLAHGYIHVRDFVLRAPMDDRTAEHLDACPVVHQARQEVRGGKPSVAVRMLPEGFVRVAGSPGHVANTGEDAEGAAQRVRDILREKPGIVAERARGVLLLPSDAEDFDAAFVDSAQGTLLHGEVLARRLSGVVSFFRGHDPKLYPRLRDMTIVRMPMSPRQAAEYSVQRRVERRREDTARRMARAAGGAGSADDGGASYRAQSRAVCNFAFPEDVPRPQMAAIRLEMAASRDVSGNRRPTSTPKNRDALTSYDDAEADAADPDMMRGETSRAYHRALDAAIDKLSNQPGRLSLLTSSQNSDNNDSSQSGGGLAELSPKFAAVITRLLWQGPPDAPRGPSIVYSEFRRGEGIRLLAAAMEANGFREMRVRRRVADNRPGTKSTIELEDPAALGSPTDPRFIVYSNDDPELASCLLNIFRGQLDEGSVPPGVLRGLREAGLLQAGATQTDLANANTHGQLVRTLLITRSGAEGISTRNVREVHIMEPFWHANRVQQVVGRARRAFSHDALPPAERALDVYIYLATLSPDQAGEHQRDGGITSDEYVHNVAVRKRRVLDALLEVMRSSAVDCQLHSARHGARSKCFTPPTSSDPLMPLYNLDLKDDLHDADRGNTNVGHTTQLVAVRIRGRMFYTDRVTGRLYDYAALKLGKIVDVGTIDD